MMAKKGSKRKMQRTKSVPVQSPPERVIRGECGSGITKRSTITFSGPFDDKDAALLIDALDRTANPYREIEETCRADLREVGIPDDPTEDGKYPFRSHITPELAQEAYHSLIWFSAAILDALAHGRWASEVGDRRGIGDAEGEIKYLWRERYIKSDIEPDALLGKKDRIPRRKGGRTRGDQIREAAAPQEKAVRRENEKLEKGPERSRAAIISRKLNIPFETVRDILQRLK